VEKLAKSSGISKFSNENEGRPEVWVWSLTSNFPHRVLERARHVTGSNVFTIKVLHQVRGALVVNIPQRKQQCRGPGTE
jgi:hypothetical protein